MSRASAPLAPVLGRVRCGAFKRCHPSVVVSLPLPKSHQEHTSSHNDGEKKRLGQKQLVCVCVRERERGNSYLSEFSRQLNYAPMVGKSPFVFLSIVFCARACVRACVRVSHARVQM